MIFLKAGVLAFMLTAAGLSQQAPIPSMIGTQTPGLPSAGDAGAADDTPFSVASRERMEKGRQSDRQRRLVADTERLLTLATELKADMDKTNKDTLSIDVIKKAEEIEKLAKSVKDRMRG